MDKERVASVVKQMSLDEKVALTNVGADLFAAALPRLKVPAMKLPKELRWYGYDDKTTFAAIGHTFDRTLCADIAKLRSRQAIVDGESFAGVVSLGVARKPFGRDMPRCFSEEPALVAEMAASFLSGSSLKVIGLPLDGVGSRNRFIGARALNEIYLRPFEKNKETLGGIALSGSLGGVNAAEHRTLMKELTRFDGFIVTLAGESGYKAEEVSSGACLDIMSPPSDSAKLKNAVESGMLFERKLDICIERNVLAAAESYNLRKAAKAPAVSTNEKQALMRRLFEESAVLLKNDGALPFARSENIVRISISPDNVDKTAKGIDKFVAGADGALVYVESADSIDPDKIGRIVETVGKDRKTVLALNAKRYFPMPYTGLASAVIYLPCDAGERPFEALEALLYGDSDFSGRLSCSWARSENDYPYAALDFKSEGCLGESVYIGNRYFARFKEGLLFEFGHGLSYHSAEIKGFKVKSGKAVFEAKASSDAVSVVQIFASLENESVFGVSGQLVAFDRLVLGSEWKRYELSLTPVEVYDPDARKSVRLGGKYTFTIRLSGTESACRATVEGEKVESLSRKAFPSYYPSDGKLKIDRREAESLLGFMGGPAEKTSDKEEKKAEMVLRKAVKRLKKGIDFKRAVSALSSDVKLKLARYFTEK